MIEKWLKLIIKLIQAETKPALWGLADQAQREEFRVGPAKIGWSAEDASTLWGAWGHASLGNFEI